MGWDVRLRARVVDCVVDVGVWARGVRCDDGVVGGGEGTAWLEFFGGIFFLFFWSLCVCVCVTQLSEFQEGLGGEWCTLYVGIVFQRWLPVIFDMDEVG